MDRKVLFAQHQRFESERLILRKVEITDAEAMFEYAHDENFASLAGFAAVKDLEDGKSTIANYFFDNRLYIYGLEHKENGQFIGTVDLTFNGDIGEFGWALNPRYWGQGLIPEAASILRDFAFDVLDLSVVHATHFVNNHQSARVMQKIGLKKYGQTFLNNRNQVRLADYYALTKADYLEMRIHNSYYPKF